MKKTGPQPMSSVNRDELQRLASEILYLHRSLLIPPSFADDKPAIERRSTKGHIPRQRNAFILFRSHLITTIIKPLLLSDQPGLHTQGATSVLSASVWRGMSNEQRKLWYQKAYEEKELHKKLYPDYKYTPKSKLKGRHSETHAKKTKSLEGATSLDEPLWLKWDSKAPKSFDDRPTVGPPDFSNPFPTQYNLFNNQTVSTIFERHSVPILASCPFAAIRFYAQFRRSCSDGGYLLPYLRCSSFPRLVPLVFATSTHSLTWNASRKVL
jgi:hypothetical protein